MKKSIYYVLVAMMVAMVSVGFVSCGGDDEEEGFNPNPSEGSNSDEDSNGENGSDTFTLTMNDEKLYAYQQKGVSSENLLAFINNCEETPCKANFMDAEDWEHSTYYYQLNLCFSRFSLNDVGAELELCPVSWKATSGYGSWEFENSFSYVKTARDGKVDYFAYVSGKITFHSLNVEKREMQIKYDNVVFECVKHDSSNIERDKVVLNGICTYVYYQEK